jgi:hypothetical protein
VSIPGLQFTQQFTVTAGQTTTITLPNAAMVSSFDVVESKGIHVTSQGPITVYGLDFVAFATDGYTALPTVSLGTEYMAVSFRNGNGGIGAVNSEFAFVATQDNTTVTVVPSMKTKGSAPPIFHPAGTPYQVKLNQGQTYQLQNDVIPGDTTGSIVTSDRPIAFFSGFLCTPVDVLAPGTGGRYLLHQMIASKSINRLAKETTEERNRTV